MASLLGVQARAVACTKAACLLTGSNVGPSSGCRDARRHAERSGSSCSAVGVATARPDLAPQVCRESQSSGRRGPEVSRSIPHSARRRVGLRVLHRRRRHPREASTTASDRSADRRSRGGACRQGAGGEPPAYRGPARTRLRPPPREWERPQSVCRVRVSAAWVASIASAASSTASPGSVTAPVCGAAASTRATDCGVLVTAEREVATLGDRDRGDDDDDRLRRRCRSGRRCSRRRRSTGSRWPGRSAPRPGSSP